MNVHANISKIQQDTCPAMDKNWSFKNISLIQLSKYLLQEFAFKFSETHCYLHWSSIYFEIIFP